MQLSRIVLLCWLTGQAACATEPDDPVDPGAVAGAPAQVAAATPAVAPAVASGVHFASTITPWRDHAFVAGWDGVHHRIAYNARGADGGFDVYWSDEAGTTSQCVTCTLPGPAAAHRGASDVYPGGDYVLATIEKPSHSGAIGSAAAEPGRGVWNDLYLVAGDGSQAFQLTDIPNDANHGIIWARFNRTGTQVVWSQMYQPANLFAPKQLAGVWQLKLADLTWTGGVPQLANIQTYEPETGNFYEPYGFSPDGGSILFASTLGMPGLGDSQLYRVSVAGGAFTGLTRLTEQVDGGPGWSNYNEFAFYLPDGQHIVYGRIREATSGGLDWWVMRADGTGRERLTYLNEPWHAQARGYAVVGGWAIDPANPDRVMFSICTALTCSEGTGLTMTLSSLPAGAGTGLTGAYYDDRSFSQLAFTRVDPGVGFNWADNPDPRMPIDNFAIRWTGSLKARVTGWHQMCVYSDDGARLTLGGWQIVNAWHDQAATQNCGWAWLDATVTNPLQLDYYDAWGTGATVKLSWTGPDGVQELVPVGQLAP
ncbi:MAG TPA: PA14 domain-containing protein [Kofleriaceae bacterium]|nr:PA14 domain-containing protein [Kofleriaceae bacterium]